MTNASRHPGKPAPSNPRRAPIGGAAAAAGIHFQDAVAAYFAVHLLVGLPLRDCVPFKQPPTLVQPNADAAVDDVKLEFGRTGRAFVQVKKRLTLPQKAGSHGTSSNFGFLAVVAQWSAAVRAPDFDPEKDVLLCVVGGASAPVLHLAAALERRRRNAAGHFTGHEVDALSRLQNLLEHHGAEEQRSLLDAAHLVVLDVESETSAAARVAQSLLESRVVSSGQGLVAWRRLLDVCGHASRHRFGLTLSDLLAALRDAPVPVELRVDAEVSLAAATELAKQVEARYRSAVAAAGATINLLDLGAAIPPIAFDAFDAGVDVHVAEAEGSQRNRRADLSWAFRRRQRALLTGLPGSGKSVALRRVAASWAGDANFPVPLLVDAKELRRELATEPRPADALAEIAARRVRVADRPVLSKLLRERLEAGTAAVIVDGLDELGDARHAFVSRLQELVEEVSPDTEILVATRDVGYAQARILGFSDLRLASPDRLDVSIKAVLTAFAQQRGMEPTGAAQWVSERKAWVWAQRFKQSQLYETPLLPILLAILAAERDEPRLPDTPGDILRTVLVSSVERHEAARREFALGPLRGREASAALLDVFMAECRVIASAGGEAPRARVEEQAANDLTARWGFPRGVAEVAAGVAVEHWDQAGFLVVQTELEIVRPRLRLFLEIGCAMSLARKDDSDHRRLVEEMAPRDDLEEVLVLAAQISRNVGRELVAHAVAVPERRVLLAVLRAYRGGAEISDAELDAIALQLAPEVHRGGSAGWEVWHALAPLPLGQEVRKTLLGALASSFPAPYVLVGRALVTETWRLDASARVAELADVLEVSALPDHTGETHPEAVSQVLHMQELMDAYEIAARQLLPLRPDLAVPRIEAIVTRLFHSEPLRNILKEQGYQVPVYQYKDAYTARVMRGDASFARPPDPDAFRRLLAHIASLGSAACADHADLRRLTSLMDLLTTLSVHDWAPVAVEEEVFCFDLVTIAIDLCGLNAGAVAAEAAELLRSNYWRERWPTQAFVSDLARTREPSRWSAPEEVTSVVDRLVAAFRVLPWTQAAIAAWCLEESPDRQHAAALLEKELTNSRPEQRWLAALTLAMHLVDGPDGFARRLAGSTDPILRQSAAKLAERERISSAVAGTITTALSLDDDDSVRSQVVSAASNRRQDLDAKGLAAAIVGARSANEWTCFGCGRTNPINGSRCGHCGHWPPDSQADAKRLLSELETLNSVPKV